MSQLVSPMIEQKKKLVSLLADKMKNSKTTLIASTKNLPSSQFHSIKKNLRGIAEIMVTKKSILLRAIAATEKGSLQKLKDHIGADIALFFSKEDAFELSRILAEAQSPTKAKAGDIAPEDITIEPGPTDLIPGPAISELSGVGLKVAVEGGKIAIKQGATVAKKGEAIKDNVAAVIGKLNITPMKVGFTPLVAYDSVSDAIYIHIKVDPKAALEELRYLISKSFAFAVHLEYIAKETISFIIKKAALEEHALLRLVNNHSNKEEAK